MHVHPPKPVHGWRALLGEIGVIVIGVLIALAAEQTVEWLHWRSELRETRQALNQELARAVGSFQYRMGLKDCADRRLDELSAWLDASRPGDAIALARPIGEPQGWSILTGAWDTAKSGQAAWRMPLEERLRYAHLYGALARFVEIQVQDSQVWRDLAAFNGGEPLDHADRMKLRGLVMTGKLYEKTFASYGPFVMPDVEALGVTPQKRVPPSVEGRRSFCQPLLKH